MKDLIETLEEYANGFINVIAPPEEDVKELLEHIYNQDKEIERLNNIINDYKIYCKKNKGFTEYTDIEIEAIEPVISKLEDILKEEK